MPGPPLRALLGACLATALLGFGEARAQVSPGPLSAAHATLDGATRCFECHVTAGRKGGVSERCLACHGEITWTRAQQRGYHTRVAAKECASCHPEHGGRDFALVAWEGGAPTKFDHRLSGFALEGRHTALACRACHTRALQKSPAAALIRRKDHDASWLGLERACEKCHADPHRAQLGADCARCHGQEKFVPAASFDHARSAYPLTGRHAKVECARCHATAAVATTKDAAGKPVPQWKPLPHADCVACHRDPHAGRFPGACAKCHDTGDFHVINRAGFDHDLTRYPLTGRHDSVACAKCHDPRAGGQGPKPRFSACGDCHADAHAGTATLAGRAVDCASCHDTGGFDRSLYTSVMHAKSAYPLAGRHASAACKDCHAKVAAGSPGVAALGRARVRMRPAFAACTSCHGDPHHGRFDAAGARATVRGCTGCHGLEAFVPARFDLVMHAQAAFSLEGAHRAAPCQACHEELKAPPARGTLLADAAHLRGLRFEDPRRACVDCHTGPHGTQFARRRDKGACQGCHDQRAFAPASRFDHERDTAFRLEGAHATLACAACHVPRRNAAGATIVVYRPTPARCEACHSSGAPAPSDSTSSRGPQR